MGTNDLHCTSARRVDPEVIDQAEKLVLRSPLPITAE
jgi:hypothetical protein